MSYLVTAPIYYANAKPHIGSLYTTILADILARAAILAGESPSSTRLLTGTDEHGLKIEQAAKKAGQAPAEFVASVSKSFEQSFLQFGLDRETLVFAHTTDPRHRQLVQTVVKSLDQAGLIYKKEYRGWYCVGCEEYKEEYQESAAAELNVEAPSCPLHQHPLSLVTEPIYFFRLSQFQDDLIRVIESQRFRIEPATRRHEVLSFLAQPLRDIPISRQRSKVAWGIDFPLDCDHTVYVWLDALLYYLTFSDETLDSTGAKPSFWPANVQLIGKDILRFHAIILPAVLLALDLPLPNCLLAHGFFTVEGQKMSKSLGNVLTPDSLLEALPGPLATEAVRYLLVTMTQVGEDADITLTRFQDRYQAELVNGLGNLTQRLITLAVKAQFEVENWQALSGSTTDEASDHTSDQTIDQTSDQTSRVAANFDLDQLKLDPNQPLTLTHQLEALWQQFEAINQRLSQSAPWLGLNPEATPAARHQAEQVIAEELNTLRRLVQVSLPAVMPVTAQTIETQIATLTPVALFPRLSTLKR